MSIDVVLPRPLFAGAETVMLAPEEYFASRPVVEDYLRSFPGKLGVKHDFQWACRFLARHNQSPGTFGNYRGFVERLLLWSWTHQGKSALALNRNDFQEFVSFSKRPPENWIGSVPKRRFLARDGGWIFNDDWRPFDRRSAALSGNDQGDFQYEHYKPFTGALRQMLSTCSSFYNFLHGMGAADVNPVAAARPQGARLEKSNHPTRRSIEPDQWAVVFATLEKMADGDPVSERALFIVAATFYMYLRPSDLATEDGLTPTMNAFLFEDSQWWLIIKKARKQPVKLLVNVKFLPYLTRYRISRGLSPLRVDDEDIAILETAHGRPGLEVRQIREIVKTALKDVFLVMRAAGESEAEINILLKASIGWVRDTGARSNARVCSPAMLQQNLRHVSLPYTYGRYYQE